MVFMVQLEQLLSRIILATTVLLFSCNHFPKLVNEEDEHLEKNKGIYYFNDQLFTGQIYKLNEVGDTVFILKVEEGCKNGLSRYYWNNGNLKRTANFKHNIYHGEVIDYFENGNIYSIFNYVDGHESGLQQVWKSDGRIKAKYEVVKGRKYGLTGVKNCENVFEDSLGHF